MLITASTTKSGYIAPDGRFFQSAKVGHRVLAGILCKQEFIEYDDRQWCDGQKVLDNLGWVKMEDGEFYYEKEPTQSQIDVMFDHKESERKA